MKVRVTTELDLTDLMIIGSALDDDGKLVKATHEQASAFLEGIIQAGMNPRRIAWRDESKKLIASLKW